MITPGSSFSTQITQVSFASELSQKGVGGGKPTLEQNPRRAVKILADSMPHKRITCCVPNLLPFLTVCGSRGAIEVLIDCSADGPEGHAWSDTRYAYLGTLLGHAEQVSTRCVLGIGLQLE